MASIKISGLPEQTTVAEDDYLVFGKDEAMKISLSALRTALGVPKHEIVKHPAWYDVSLVSFPQSDLPLMAWKSGKVAHIYGFMHAETAVPAYAAFITFPEGWRPAVAINKLCDGVTLSINNGVMYSDSGIDAGVWCRIDFSYPIA